MSKKPEEYEDIPGTWVFDAQRARKGYHLNAFFYSLMKAENRAEFLADERKYLHEVSDDRGAARSGADSATGTRCSSSAESPTRSPSSRSRTRSPISSWRRRWPAFPKANT